MLGAGATIRNFSPAFGKLMSKEQQLEGEYRQLHSRLRTHAESIALYGGENREEFYIQKKFNNLVRHMRIVLHDHWWFGMIQDFLLKYLGATVAVILIIEPFFSGNLRPDSSTLGRAEMLSNLRYHTSVIISLFQSLGTLSISSRRLNRLRYFLNSMLYFNLKVGCTACWAPLFFFTVLLPDLAGLICTTYNFMFPKDMLHWPFFNISMFVPI